MKRRTIDELILYVEGFLNELNGHFIGGDKVLFRELQIERNGTKYHINSRLRCEIMKAEYNESHRYYTRKYNTPPTREIILSWINASYETRVVEYKRTVVRHADRHDEILECKREYRKQRREEISKTNSEYYNKNREKIRIRKRALVKARAAQKVVEVLKDFDSEFELIRPKLQRYIKPLACGDYRDLMQDTYLEARTSFHRYDGTCKLTTWIFQIANNLNMQRFKKQRFEKNKLYFVEDYHESIMEIVDRHSASESNEKENEIEYPENGVMIIENCIKELSKVQKEHLELFIEGKSHAEIGEILGISADYSKVRLRIIRQLLAKKIEPKLNVKIKSYTNNTEAINITAHKKTFCKRVRKKIND